MKRILLSYIALIFAGLIAFNNIDKNTDSNNFGNNKSLIYNNDYNYSFKSDNKISIIVKDTNGNLAKGIKVAVYPQNPIINEGFFNPSIFPLLIGHTNEIGEINQSITVPMNVSKLYIIPLAHGYGTYYEVLVSEQMQAIVQNITNYPKNKKSTTSTQIRGSYNSEANTTHSLYSEQYNDQIFDLATNPELVIIHDNASEIWFTDIYN